MTISKVSEITAQDLAEYLRLTETDAEDLETLNTLLSVAKSYTKQWTGQDDDGLDDSEDYVIVVLILVQDMWDNRTMYVDSASSNPTIKSILGLHQVNLL